MSRGVHGLHCQNDQGLVSLSTQMLESEVFVTCYNLFLRSDHFAAVLEFSAYLGDLQGWECTAVRWSVT